MAQRSTWAVYSEAAIEWLIRLCGISAIIFVFGIFFFVFREGAPFLFKTAKLGAGDIIDVPGFAAKLKDPSDPVSQYLQSQLSAETLDKISAFFAETDGKFVAGTDQAARDEAGDKLAALSKFIRRDLNKRLAGPPIYEESRFAGVELSQRMKTLIKEKPKGGVLLNRKLLEEAYPAEIGTNKGLHFAEFFFSTEWYPSSESNIRYGVGALILGTASVTILAMLIAVPFGLGAAIFVSEFCGPKLKETMKITIELLAAIPSVVWGFIGLTIMNQVIIAVFDAPVGLNVLNGGILLALMSVPIIVSIGEDALKAVPDSYREAGVALGATRWQLVYKVLLPAAKNGLLAAVLLGVGRAVGETMAVLMATGHSVNVPHGPLDSVRTLTATIAAELGETVDGSAHYQVLFIIGILLFSITFAVNLTADLVVRGIRNK